LDFDNGASFDGQTRLTSKIGVSPHEPAESSLILIDSSSASERAADIVIDYFLK
jgi:hypothetical protein